MESVETKLNNSKRIGSECGSKYFGYGCTVSQTRKPVHVLTPHASGFLVEVSMKALSETFPVRLTKDDFQLLHSIAKEIEIKPGQLARYAIRKLIHEKLQECERQGRQ
jgi:hypothetical protein